MSCKPVPDQWTRRTLRELATINYGRDPASILDADGSYPVYGTSGNERLGTAFLYDGDSIILGRKGTIDRVHYATGRFWAIDTAYFLSKFNDAIPKWLYYFLASIDLRSLNEATGVPSLSRDLLYKINVLTPPVTEQSKISEILSTVDRAIEQTEALIAKHQRIKTGLIQDLLTRGIDENGNLRSEHIHKFKDSSVGRIPSGWEVPQLGSVSKFITSGARGWAQYYRDEGAIFIRIGNLTREHIDLRLDDLVFVQPTGSVEGQRTSVIPGDLLISVTADLGIIGVVPDQFGEGYVNQHIALVRLDLDQVCSRFVGWFFSSWGGRAQFDRLNESGAKAGLNLPAVRSLRFPLPDIDEQRRIAKTIDASVATINIYASNRQKLIALKKGLMQDLLTGKHRVTALFPTSESVSA